MATDLRNREIVLSKLGSRFANMALLVLTGLPILSCLQFLGGVDPNLVWAGFAVTVVTMVSVASVSILCSVVCKKSWHAIALAYLFVVMYDVVSLMLFGATQPPSGVLGWGKIARAPIWFGDHPPVVVDAIEAFANGNLVTLLRAVKDAGAAGTLATSLPLFLRDYALFHGLLTLGCLVLAVALVRRFALAEPSGRALKVTQTWRVGRRPPVGQQPMVWKEFYFEARRPWFGLRLILLTQIVVTIFLPVVWIFMMTLLHPEEPIKRHVNTLVRIENVLVGCLTVLAIAIRASTTISRERDKQTLDTLLTTPLSSASILHAKWLGSLLSQRLGLLLLAMTWVAGIATGGLSSGAFPLMLFAWVIYAVFAASLGLWFSTACRSSVRAAVLSTVTLIGIWAGHWMMVPVWQILALRPATSDLVHRAHLGVLTPPFVMWYLASYSGDSPRPHDVEPGLGEFCVLGFVAWAAAAFCLYRAANRRFRRETHRDTTELLSD